MTIMRGTDFGKIWCASGTRGFFGEGYWFHHINPFLFALKQTTFVAKTITLNSNTGNMQLQADTWQPKEWFPNCIKFNISKGIALNAIALSNFGIEAALATGNWGDIEEPFMLSFMPTSKTYGEKIEETRKYVQILLQWIGSFKVKIALQVNLSCPNMGEDLKKLEDEAVAILELLDMLDIPLIPKFNVLTSPKTVARIAQETQIDAVCVSNTIPYGQMDGTINWTEQFGSQSPMKHLGGGGLSGAPLFPLVLEWVKHAKEVGLSIPINAGGGIMHPFQVNDLMDAGADSVSIGTVAMLRPWRVPSIVARANSYR